MAKRNMKRWVEETIATQRKDPLPVLSFPCVQLMGVSVRELISSSQLQARGMQLVAERVKSAAAVSLMDLSVEAECFGSPIHISDDEVPTVVGAIVADEEQAEALAIPPVGSGRTGLYVEALRQAAQLIGDRPVFAGVIGPFSLAGRLMGVSEALIYCLEEPDMVHILMKKATAFLVEYCRAYKEAGANGVVVAEPLTGLLSPVLAAEFSHPYMRELVEAVQEDDFAVIYHNCGGSVTAMAEDIYAIGAMGYHFGDAIDLASMLPASPVDRLVMGNVSPSACLRNGSVEQVRAQTHKVMKECSAWPNFVPSSGCDIPPLSPWENIDAFFAAAAEFYGA